MNCIYCYVSGESIVLYRTAPLGVVPAGWACGTCLTENHPELVEVIYDLKDIVETILDNQEEK